MSANIVYFANFSFVNDKVNSFAMVFNIEPVTDIKTFTINRKWLVILCVCNHKRNEFFRKMIWTIVVGTSAYCNRKPVSSVVCKNE